MEINRKDRLPESTISYAEKVLKKIGMNYRVVSEHSYKNNWYSCNIEICQLPGIFSNGKGITKEYALASALGEMLERLQCGLLINREFYNKEIDILDGEQEKKIIQISRQYLKTSLKNQDDLVLEKFFRKYPKYATVKEYKQLFKGNTVLIPHELIHYICGSNGTCSGNNKEEALCQGLSEIYERYVLKQIFFGKKQEIFSSIKVELFQQYLQNMIAEIEKKGYYVKIKDLTLSNSVPVLGILVINKNKTRYAFSIGSDIDANICLQRCITELFQGMNFDFSFRCSMKEIWTTYSCRSEYWTLEETADEYMKNLINKSGHIPLSVLKDNGLEEDYLPTIFVEVDTNEKALEYHENICEKNKWDVYLKNCNFLNFPAYRIFIPEITEAFYLPNEDWIRTISNIEDAKKIFVNLEDKNEYTKQKFIEIINKIHNNARYRNNSVSMNKLLGFLFGVSDEFEYLKSFSQLQFELSLELGKTNQALKSINEEILSEKNRQILTRKVRKKLVFPRCPECSKCGLKKICCKKEYDSVDISWQR